MIFNPIAGTAGSPDLWLGRIVHKLGVESHSIVTVRATSPELSVNDLIKTTAFAPDLVIAAGGDGTVRQVISAVIATESGAPIGIIPLGTGNQLARNLGIYQDNILVDPVEAALKVILHGRRRQIDLGRMNGHYFCIAAGAGPLSDAVIMPGHQDKASWKMLAYASSMIQTFALPPAVFEVAAEGDSFVVSASGIFVTNVGDLGMGTLSATADLSDGLLDLCILDPSEFSHYIELGFSFAGGFVGGKAPYYIRKVKSVDIKAVPVRSRLSPFQKVTYKIRSFLTGEPTRPPLRKQEVTAMIDGDACGSTPMHIEVVPDAVSVLVPA